MSEDPPITWRLIAEARKGNRRAFEDLVRSQAPRLFGIAFRITRDAALSEDVVQETFVRLLEDRSSPKRPTIVEGQSSPSLVPAGELWLNKVAVHAAIDEVRRRRARLRREERYAMAGTPRGKEPGDLLLESELHALVTEGFAGLPFEARAAIWLNVVEGEPVREIAKALGGSGHRLYRTIHKGLDDLREFLKRRGAIGAFALPLPELLSRIPAPAAPPGLVERILEGTPLLAAGTGTAGSGAQSGPVLSVMGKGGLGMAVVSGKKMAIGITLAVLLLLLGTVFIVDPFHLRRGERRDAGVPAPRAISGKTTTPKVARRSSKAARSKDPGPATAEETKGDRPETRSYGSLVIRVIWGDDKKPAEGIRLSAVPWGDPRPFLHLEEAVTDAEGKARLARIYQGNVSVSLDRGGGGMVKVEAGKESEVTIEVPPGMEIEGIVVDGNGKPFPGALIWLSDTTHSSEGAVIDAAGPDGKFRIRSVVGSNYLGARAPGYTPSNLHLVEKGGPGVTRSVRLVLEKPGVFVEGTVVDPEERPIPGAVVRILGRVDLKEVEPGLVPPSPLLARTDEEGRFRFEEVTPGEPTLAVYAQGFAPWREALAVPESGISDLMIALEEGVTVTGTVHSPDGKPAQGVIILVKTLGPQGEFHDGYHTFVNDFGAFETYTALDGSFRVSGVRPGEFEVSAGDHQLGGRAVARFTAEAGEEVLWEPELSFGNEITGRVVDETGRPVEEVSVGAREAREDIKAYAWTDSEGRFRLSNCKDIPYRLEVRTKGSDFACLTKDNVRPGKGEEILCIPAGSRPSAFIAGSTVDQPGRTAGSVKAIFSQVPERGVPVYSIDPGKSFRFGPLPPGRYRIQLWIGDRFHVPLGERDLQVGETLDLGAILLPRGGRLHARLRTDEGKPIPFRLLPADEITSEISMKPEEDGTFTSEPCAPGEFIIRVDHPGVAAARIPVRIEDGQTTSIDLVLNRGANQRFKLSIPSGTAPDDTVQVIVRDAEGKAVLHKRIQASADGTDAPATATLVSGFAPGAYTVEASTPLGLRAEGSFAIGSIEERRDPILLELR